MAVLDDLHAKRDIILALAKQHGIEDVRVFGSVARREENLDSDIDILINSASDSQNAFGFIGFKEDVETLMHRKVDVVFERGLYPPLKKVILQDVCSL